ncbi:MAG: type 4a pilus biogenesis protein PilO [Nitrospirae bacterium]|nr:type 4a pilus biogenesis protein PilO [Nitrospirota bacterium]
MNLDILKNIPSYQKAAMFILILLIIIGGFFYFIYFPKNNKITALEKEIAKFNDEITVNKTKLRRLDELKAENEMLQRRLIELKEQLPTETDASALLKQVSELGVQTGLDFKSWKPGARKQNPSGLYMEMPAAVEVDGSYHNLGIFFDRIRKLSRIVNITGLNMDKPKIVRNKIHVQATFTTTAFSAVEGAAKKDEQKKDESKKAQKQPPAQPKKK